MSGRTALRRSCSSTPRATGRWGGGRGGGCWGKGGGSGLGGGFPRAPGGGGGGGGGGGAEAREGRESKAEFGEPFAPEVPDHLLMGSTLLFRARDQGRPVPFTAPA